MQDTNTGNIQNQSPINNPSDGSLNSYNQQSVPSNTVQKQQQQATSQQVPNQQPVESNTVANQVNTYSQDNANIQQSNQQQQSNPKPTVMVVEDERDALELYVYSLQSEDKFNVISAVDGEDALQKLSQNKVDLVLLDIMMPKKDGVETLAELKKNSQAYGSPKVVMLTNIGGDIAIDKAMSLGADGYMLKSEVEPMELMGIINQYLPQPAQ